MACSDPWIDSETNSTIHKEDKLFKKYKKKSGLEVDKGQTWLRKMALQKAIAKKGKHIFKSKLNQMPTILKNYGSFWCPFDWN